MNKTDKSSPLSDVLDTFLASIETKAFRMAELATRNTVDAMDVLEFATRQWVKKAALSSEEEWKGQFFAVLCKTINDFERSDISLKRRFNLRNETVCLQDVEPSDRDLSETEAFQAEQAKLSQEVIGAISHLALPQQQVLLMNVWLGFDDHQIARLLDEPPLIISNRFKSAIKGLHEAFFEDDMASAKTMTDEQVELFVHHLLDESAQDVSYAQQYQLRQIRLYALRQLHPQPIFKWIVVIGLMGFCLFVFWWLSMSGAPGNF